MQSQIAVPGGFVTRSAITSRLDLEDWACALCLRDSAPGWFHVATGRLVCAGCLRDPWADDGDAGRRAAALLTGTPDALGPYVY